MYSNKYLLFSTGGGSSDPLNWDSSEAALYNAQNFEGMKPGSARTIDMFFKTSKGKEIVTLNIKNGSHIRVMTAIGNSLVTGKQAIVPVVDVNNGNFIHKDVYGATIKSYTLATQTLSGTTHAKISLDHAPTSITLSATSAAVMSLWITDITGGDIQDTGVNVNYGSGYAATISSQAIVVDGTSATNDLLLNEKVWKSDGTLFGTCTAVGSTTGITFGGGLENAIADDDDLYTGNRYYIFKSLTIPAGSTLVLDNDEVNFPLYKYDMFAQLASGAVSLIARY